MRIGLLCLARGMLERCTRCYGTATLPVASTSQDVASAHGATQRDGRSADTYSMRKQPGSKIAGVRRFVGVALIALAVSTGCIAQNPPGKDFTEDLQQDFENEDYFNP